MTELLLLDVRTLAFATSISGFLMAATMLGLYLAGMRSRALIDWAIAGLGFGLGYLVGHLLQTITVPIQPWVAGALANALIGLGHGFLLIGVQRYLGHKCWTGPVLVIVFAMFLSSFLFPELRESLRLRVSVHSGLYVLIDAWAGLLLWRARRPGMLAFHRVAAVVLLIFAGFLLVRLVYALFSPALTTSFVQDPFQIGIFLASMVFGFCITMALAVMLFREKQVELIGLATRDPLTGINNRLGLDEAAERHWAVAAEHGTPLSLVMFDIDHFKRINDRHGHQAGDIVLSEVARRIGQVLRDSDSAFRVGGEEFLVLLPGAKADQAGRVAERLRQSMAATPIKAKGAELSLSASFGVVECQVDAEDWQACMQRVDRALYRAKRAGRDRVEMGASEPSIALS